MSRSTRRHWLVMAGAAPLALHVVRAAPPGSDSHDLLPLSQSMPDELRVALSAGQPLVVMVSLDGCPFCRVARRHYLGPLRTQQGVPVVQIDMKSSRPLQDLDGRMITHDQRVQTWGIRIAPTVLFFGRGGREIAPRLEGAGLADYYGAYLDQRLEQCRAHIRRTG